MQKTVATDAEGKTVKAERKDISEIIDPFVHKATGGKAAVNYDVEWAGTRALGDSGPGVWRSRPWNRPHGPLVRQLQEKMKEARMIEWEDDALYFTHEQGVAASETYMKDVLQGKVKANKRSWGPHFDVKKGRITSRFYTLAKKFAKQFNIDPHPAGKIDGHDAEEGVWYEQLTELYPDLYSSQAKPKAQPAEGGKETITEEEVTTSKKIDIDALELDELKGPDAEELMDEEEVEVDAEVVDVTDEDETEEVDEPLVTAVTAVDAPISSTMQGFDADEIAEAIENEEYTEITVFTDASKERIDFNSESLMLKTDGGEIRQDHLIYVPGLDSDRLLPPGRHCVGDPETGRFYLFEIVEQEPDEN